MIGQLPRLARIIQLGWKSGRMADSGNAMIDAAKAMGASKIPSELATASRTANAGVRMATQATNTGKVANNYGKYHGFSDDTTRQAVKFGHDVGKFANPIVTPVEAVAKPTIRFAGQALNNPVGMTAIGFAPFMLMSGQQTEEMPAQEMPLEAYLPPQPQAYGMQQEMIMSSPLNEEQIRRARKRAEENAALNQFYAQQLSQYGG